MVKGTPKWVIPKWVTPAFIIATTIAVTVLYFLVFLEVAPYAPKSSSPSIKGDQGIQGAKGDQGIQGVKGDPGTDGAGFTYTQTTLIPAQPYTGVFNVFLAKQSTISLTFYAKGKITFPTGQQYAFMSIPVTFLDTRAYTMTRFTGMCGTKAVDFNTDVGYDANGSLSSVRYDCESVVGVDKVCTLVMEFL